MSDVMQQTHHKPGCPWLVNPGLYRCTCFPTGAELAAQQKYTEMTSLREIKDKLDLALAMLNDRKGQDKKRDEQFNALAESQGKLLAALNDVNGRAILITGFLEGWQSRIDKQFAGLHETAMRNHQQLRKELGDEIEKVEVLLLRVLARPPRKASKKAHRRAAGRGE